MNEMDYLIEILNAKVEIACIKWDYADYLIAEDILREFNEPEE